MPYRIAGIDVHKKMLAVAVADVEVEDAVPFERLKVGTSPVQLRALAEWLVEREVEEVVMESTAQYTRQDPPDPAGRGGYHLFQPSHWPTGTVHWPVVGCSKFIRY